jgi:hypothetical protein
MKNKILTILFVLLTISGYSQFSFKKEWPTLTTALLAGGFEGISETLQHHYPEFDMKFPNANQQFWNPSLSWRNKYRNGDYLQGERFPGSSTIFVWTTDGYHLMRMNRNVLLVSSALFYNREKKTFKQHLLGVCIHSAAFSLGFNLVHNIIFHRP